MKGNNNPRRQTVTNDQRSALVAVWGRRRFRNVEHVACSVNLAVPSNTSHTDRIMDHSCLVRWVLWPGNVHALVLNVFTCSCQNETGTSTTIGSAISESERTCKSRENNIAGDVFQAAARIAACVVDHSISAVTTVQSS